MVGTTGGAKPGVRVSDTLPHPQTESSLSRPTPDTQNASCNILGEVRALVAPPQVMPTCSLRPPWASGTQFHHTLILASLLLLTVGCPQSSRRSHCCPTFQSGRGRGGGAQRIGEGDGTQDARAARAGCLGGKSRALGTASGLRNAITGLCQSGPRWVFLGR